MAAASATKPDEAKKPADAPKDKFDSLFEGGKGYERVDVPEIDGWFQAATNAFFFGQIVSYFQIEDKKKGGYRDILVLRLGEECASAVGKDKQPTTLPKGAVMAVGLQHKLRPLLEYVTHKGIVGAKCLEKVSIGGGQTMWTFKIMGKGQKAAPPAVSHLTESEGKSATGTSFDDIPF